MEMVPEKGPVLRPGVVNIVGETHNESEKRRDIEIEFVHDMLGNDAGYWTETDFPTEQWEPASMSRKPRDKTGKQDAPTADLMEYRGAQAAVIMVGAFGQLCDAASKVGARTDQAAGAAVTAFIDQSLQPFISIMQRAKASWEPTDPASVPPSGRDQFIKVNTAVEKAFADIRRLLNMFLPAMRNAPTAQGRLAAIRVLGDASDIALGMLEPLSAVVGVSGKGGAEKIEQEIQDERSISMALGAVWLGKVGVYKVGAEHITDLARIKVDASKINIVTEEAFNQALEAWMTAKAQALRAVQALDDRRARYRPQQRRTDT